jgi:hypothetical protein
MREDKMSSPEETLALVFSLLLEEGVATDKEGRTSRGVGGTPTGGTIEDEGFLGPAPQAI